MLSIFNVPRGEDSVSGSVYGAATSRVFQGVRSFPEGVIDLETTRVLRRCGLAVGGVLFAVR